MSEAVRLPKTIMVAVDGSENANRGVDFALELADKIQSRVIFVHVVDLPPPSSSLRITLYDEMKHELEDIGKEILSGCEKKATKRGIPCESSLVIGDPADKLLEASLEKKCDCIVMGKRGLGRLERLLMGSVSDKVSKLSSIPVVLIK